MQTFDHIIVGGGIIGASIAWHLSRQPCGSVLLLERNELASAASSRAAGLVLQATAKAAKTPLVKLTRETIPVLEAELGEAVGFHPVGSLRITADQARAGDLETLVMEAADNQIPVEWLNVSQAQELVPWLDASASLKMAYFPTDGYIDPYLISMAYANAARARGVQIRTRTAVQQISHDPGRVTGVSTSNGVFHCGHLIDAAGAWAGVVSAQAGYALPLAPVRSHYWISAPSAALAGDHPVTVLPDAAAYTRPEVGGLLIGVQETPSATFDARSLPDDPAAFSATTGESHWDTLAGVSQTLKRFFPEIHNLQFSHYISGLSTYTPDGSIILGKIPGFENFYAASGCCGSGISLSAGIGQSVAELVLGREPSFDLSLMNPGRFGPVEPFTTEFRDRCALARSHKTRR